MSLLKEVFKPKPIAESVTGVKLYRIQETLEPGTKVRVDGKPGIIKKALKKFSGDEQLYMIVQPGRNVVVASEYDLEIVNEAKHHAQQKIPVYFTVTFHYRFNGNNIDLNVEKTKKKSPGFNPPEELVPGEHNNWESMWSYEAGDELSGFTRQYCDNDGYCPNYNEHAIMDKAAEIIRRDYPQFEPIIDFEESSDS